MGRQRVNIFISCTALFTAFVLGFFLGRNYNHAQVQISNLSAPQLHTTEAAIQTITLQEFSPTESNPPVETVLTSTEATQAFQEQATAPKSDTSEAPSDHSGGSGLININTASVAQLETLPGIGAVIAQRIVDYRNTYGPFTSVYALTNVKGIGEKRLAAILNLITI